MGSSQCTCNGEPYQNLTTACLAQISSRALIYQIRLSRLIFAASSGFPDDRETRNICTCLSFHLVKVGSRDMVKSFFSSLASIVVDIVGIYT